MSHSSLGYPFLYHASHSGYFPFQIPIDKNITFTLWVQPSLRCCLASSVMLFPRRHHFSSLWHLCSSPSSFSLGANERRRRPKWRSQKKSAAPPISPPTSTNARLRLETSVCYILFFLERLVFCCFFHQQRLFPVQSVFTLFLILHSSFFFFINERFASH